MVVCKPPFYIQGHALGHRDEAWPAQVTKLINSNGTHYQGTWPQNPHLATRLWCLYVEKTNLYMRKRFRDNPTLRANHIFQSSLSGQDGPSLHTWAWKMGQAVGPASCRLAAAGATCTPLQGLPLNQGCQAGIHYDDLTTVPESNLKPATQDVTYF